MRALSFEKAISIGFKSGLYFGRNRNHAPISFQDAGGDCAPMGGEVRGGPKISEHVLRWIN